MLEWPYPKDPESDLAYTVYWGDFLAPGETITASTWEIPTGVTSSDDGFENKENGIQIGGGEAGEDYIFTPTIGTSLGNTIQRDIKLKVRDR